MGPSMEDDLRWKTTFDGRQPLMEDDLRWKTTMRTTSKTKRTCTLVEGTRRWTYSALRYFLFSFEVVLFYSSLAKKCQFPNFENCDRFKLSALSFTFLTFFFPQT